MSCTRIRRNRGNKRKHSQLESVGCFLQEVYSPQKRVPDVDIVFVHGLNPINQKSYAYAAWMHPNGTLWPRDLLPAEVPNARMLIFGYNSNVAFNVSPEGTREHANNLLSQLSLDRTMPEVKRRPIIFVAHSLGGLVVKQALVTAVHNNRTYGDIKQSTRALMFFGTPHQGGNGATLGRVTANIISAIGGTVTNNLLRYLEKHSVLTQNLNEDFSYQQEDYRVVTFFEARKTKMKKTGIFGTYISAIVVDAKSAKLGLGGREIQLSMDYDHTNMNKFAERDHMYEPVAGHLKILADFCVQGTGDNKEQERKSEHK